MASFLSHVQTNVRPGMFLYWHTDYVGFPKGFEPFVAECLISVWVELFCDGGENLLSST